MAGACAKPSRARRRAAHSRLKSIRRPISHAPPVACDRLAIVLRSARSMIAVSAADERTGRARRTPWGFHEMPNLGNHRRLASHCDPSHGVFERVQAVCCCLDQHPTECFHGRRDEHGTRQLRWSELINRSCLLAAHSSAGFFHHRRRVYECGPLVRPDDRDMHIHRCRRADADGRHRHAQRVECRRLER
jgi:hypothetical protein